MGEHQVSAFSEDELKERILTLFNRCGGEIKAMHQVDRHAILDFAKELAEQSYLLGVATSTNSSSVQPSCSSMGVRERYTLQQ